MKISIALCTYNGEKFLTEQVNSFLTQTRLPDEVVVCDDCSQDKTVEIIRDFDARAPFPVRLYANETNLRSTKNFEKAISLCEGDIILLSDQDDVWLPEKLQLFEAEYLKDSTVGIVFCNGELVDEQLVSLNRTSWDLREFKGERFKRFILGKTFEVLCEGNFVSGCMMSFHTKFRKLVLPIPTGLPYVIHDYWIALLLSSVSRAVPLSASPLVKYRQHTGQQLGLAPTVTQPSEVMLRERIQKKPLFDDELLRMTTIAERLNNFSNEFPCEKTLTHLKQYIAHMQARAALQNKQSARVVTVFKELASLRYHRYSKGIKSAVKDLML